MADLKPVYLIVGGDRPKVEMALRRLRERVGRDAVEEHYASELPGDAAVAACNAMGLFATEARVVLVKDVGAWKDADAKAVAAYLADPAPGTVLVLVGESVKETSTLAKACKKAGELLSYGFDRKQLPKWVAQQFAARGVDVEPEACALLVQLAVPEGQEPERKDIEHISNEVAKLALWADGAPLTVADVEALAVPVADLPVFTLTDAWGRRDLGAVLRAVETLFEREGKARRDVAPRLLGSVVAHVQRVRQCKSLADEGVTAKDAASRLKRHPFYVQKLYAQAQNYSTEELRDAVVTLAQLDHALKGGSRLAPDLELERALVALTRGADRSAATAAKR